MISSYDMIYDIISYEKRQNLGIFRVLFFSPPHPFPYCDSLRRGQPLPNF